MLNEGYQRIDENMRFEALAQLREIQSNLVGISFLPVIAIMKQENPLKKDVLKFQDRLDELTAEIQSFISKAKNDIDYQPSEEEIEAEEVEAEEEPKEPKKEKKVEDSTEDKKDV